MSSMRSPRGITLKWTTFRLESTFEDSQTREQERLVRANASPDHSTGLHLISGGLWGFESADSEWQVVGPSQRA